MVKGDKCWIIENGIKVTAAEIMSISGNLILIKTEDGKAIRLPKHRIFDSEEKAKEKVSKQEKKRRTQYDYML